jgi:hypothetical protein
VKFSWQQLEKPLNSGVCPFVTGEQQIHEKVLRQKTAGTNRLRECVSSNLPQFIPELFTRQTLSCFCSHNTPWREEEKTCITSKFRRAKQVLPRMQQRQPPGHFMMMPPETSHSPPVSMLTAIHFRNSDRTLSYHGRQTFGARMKARIPVCLSRTISNKSMKLLVPRILNLHIPGNRGCRGERDQPSRGRPMFRCRVTRWIFRTMLPPPPKVPRHSSPTNREMTRMSPGHLRGHGRPTFHFHPA